MKMYSVLLFILVLLCLAYSMTKKIDESLDSVPNIFDLIYDSNEVQGAFSMTNCSNAKEYVQNNANRISEMNDSWQTGLNEFRRSRMYTVFLNENSAFYSERKFDCWIELVKQTLNSRNTVKVIDILTKIINILNKIKSKFIYPIPGMDTTIVNMNNLTDSIHNLSNAV